MLIMWKRKELKSRGIRSLKNNYFRIVAVIMIIAFIVGGFILETFTSTNDTLKSYVALLPEKVSEPTLEIWDKFDMTSHEAIKTGKTKLNLEKPTAGVFASIYNKTEVATGTIRGILLGENKILKKHNISGGIVILVYAIFLFFVWLFIGQPLLIGQRRYMLESRLNGEMSLTRILFVWRKHKGCHVSGIMFIKFIKMFLWKLTIVGGVIKYYEYKMIPYILAENPTVERKEVFALSKKMMQGNKWKTFKLDVSFLGWYLLNIVTFGLLEWFFIAGYRETSYAELYIVLRNQAKEEEYENAQLLNDETLVNPIKFKEKTLEVKILSKFDYKKKYALTTYVLMFFTFSFIGWTWEVLMHVYQDGVFVNRGVLHGPILPIYGAGGVVMIILLKKFADKPLLTMILGMLLAGILEYVTATYLLNVKHVQYWEYNGYFCNIQGKVCAEGLLLFGIGGLGFIYLLGPACDKIFARIPKRVKDIACIVLILLLIVDSIYTHFYPNTGKGITDYGMNLWINNIG